MDSNKPSTSQERVPLHVYPNTPESEGQGNGALRRSHTDAQFSNYRPQVNVRFNTLAAGLSTYETNDGMELLSAKAHQIGHSSDSRGWQNTILKRRQKGFTPKSDEEEFQEIIDAMQSDDRLMADDVDGEMIRRNALREMTKSLRVRRELKQRLSMKRSASLQRSHRSLSLFKVFQYYLSMKFVKLWESIGIAFHDYSLWQSDLKKIEGIHGSSIGSYFFFLRYLFLLNSVVSLIIIGFLLVPQHLVNGSESHLNEQIGLKSSRNLNSTNFDSRPKFQFLDWLTGSGWLSDSSLYYKGYAGNTQDARSPSLAYDVPQAYFFTICCCFLFYLVVLLYRILVLYRTNYIDATEDPTVVFVEKVFLAWDFNITDEKAAEVKHRSIYNELTELSQELLSEQKIETVCSFLRRRTVQFLVWFVLSTFLSMLCWGLYVLLKGHLHNFHAEDNYWANSLKLLIYPIIVTFVVAVLPMVLESASRIESYNKPRYELYVSVVRVYLVGLCVVLALVLFWYENSPGLMGEPRSVKQRDFKVGRTKKAMGTTGPNSNSTVYCWESALGEEIFRLVMLDFLVIAVSTLIVDKIKVVLAKRGNIRESALRFSVAANTLRVIYNQALLWVGFFFCPLLPVVVSIKFLLIFYAQKHTVLNNLQPTKRPWRAAQTETLFQALTLLSLILTLFGFGFIVIRGYSSPSCGPFQNYTHYLDIVWDAFKDNDRVVLTIFSFINRADVSFFFLIILGLCVYCLKNVAQGRAEMVSLLRKQLQLEMKDRAFLQSLIENVNKDGIVHPANKSGFSPKKSDSGNLTRRASFTYSKNMVDIDHHGNDTQL